MDWIGHGFFFYVNEIQIRRLHSCFFLFSFLLFVTCSFLEPQLKFVVLGLGIAWLILKIFISEIDINCEMKRDPTMI